MRRGLIAAIVALAVVVLSTATVAASMLSSSPGNAKSINAHPIGTVGAETAGAGGMPILCRVPAGTQMPGANATLAQVQSFCAKNGK